MQKALKSQRTPPEADPGGQTNVQNSMTLWAVHVSCALSIQLYTHLIFLVRPKFGRQRAKNSNANTAKGARTERLPVWPDACPGL